MTIEDIEKVSKMDNKKLSCTPEVKYDFLLKCSFETKEDGLIWLIFNNNKLIRGSFIINGPIFMEEENLALTDFGNSYLENLTKAYGESKVFSKDPLNKYLIFHFPNYEGVKAVFYHNSLNFSFEVKNYNEIIEKEWHNKKISLNNNKKLIFENLCLPEINFEEKISICGLATGINIENFMNKDKFKSLRCNFFKNEVHQVMGVREDFGCCFIKLREQNIWINIRGGIIFNIHVSIKGNMLLKNKETLKPTFFMEGIINKISSNLNIKNNEITDYNKGKNDNYLYTFWEINENEIIHANFFQNELMLKLSEQYGWPYLQIEDKVEEFLKKGGKFTVINFTE